MVVVVCVLVLVCVIVLRRMCQPKTSLHSRVHIYKRKMAWHMAQALEEMRELQSAKGGVDASMGALPPKPLFLYFPLPLSFPLPFPPSIPLLAIPPRPTPFSVCLCLASCLPRRLATSMQEDMYPPPRLATSSKKPACGWLQAFAEESRNPNPETRNMTHDGGHVHAHARHRRAFGESLRSLAPFSPGLCCQQGMTKNERLRT